MGFIPIVPEPGWGLPTPNVDPSDWEDDEDETPAPKANYALKSAPTKTSKAAKFDALFEDEE